MNTENTPAWTCPHCDITSPVNEDFIQKNSSELLIENSEGLRELITIWNVCPYEECRKITLTCYLYEIILDPSDTGFPKRDRLIKKWELLP